LIYTLNKTFFPIFHWALAAAITYGDRSHCLLPSLGWFSLPPWTF